MLLLFFGWYSQSVLRCFKFIVDESFQHGWMLNFIKYFLLQLVLRPYNFSLLTCACDESPGFMWLAVEC
jgi:hypothetical protein